MYLACIERQQEQPCSSYLCLLLRNLHGARTVPSPSHPHPHPHATFKNAMKSTTNVGSAPKSQPCPQIQPLQFQRFSYSLRNRTVAVVLLVAALPIACTLCQPKHCRKSCFGVFDVSIMFWQHISPRQSLLDFVGSLQTGTELEKRFVLEISGTSVVRRHAWNGFTAAEAQPKNKYNKTTKTNTKQRRNSTWIIIHVTGLVARSVVPFFSSRFLCFVCFGFVCVCAGVVFCFRSFVSSFSVSFRKILRHGRLFLQSCSKPKFQGLHWFWS